MSKMNVEPLITFSNGSQLLVSTRYVGDGHFICELFMLDAQSGAIDGKNLRAVTGGMEAPTCRQAQDFACGQARRLFPDNAPKIKEPPYLVWTGPNLPVAPDNRGRRSMQ
jgi:hypothetical protein